MDLDAMRRAAEMAVPHEGDDYTTQDDMLTEEEWFDDMQPEPGMIGEPAGRPIEATTEQDPTQAIAIEDEELAALLEREIDQAEMLNEEEDTVRRAALDYYYGRLPAQTCKGRSGVVSKDVAAVTEAVLSQVMQAFATDQLVMFAPDNPQDEEQATIEAQVCNWVFSQDCGGSDILHSSFKDALILGLGVGKVYWCEQSDVTFDEYQNLQQMELPMALQPRHPGERVEVVGQEQGENGVSLRIRRVRSEDSPKVESVAPHNFLFHPNHDSLFLDECKFVAERIIVTESDLIDMGFDEELVQSLPTHNPTEDDRYSSRKRYQTPTSEVHHSNRDIEVYECYYRVDRDGDSYAELVKAFFADGKVLEADECDECPYVLCSPFPVPHEVIGESIYDKVKQEQDVKTEFLRIAIDNGLVNTFGRFEIQEGVVNLTDFLNPQPGGVVRSKRVGSVAPIPNISTADVPLQIMNYMDKSRSEAAGPALDMQNENLPVGVQTAHGAERVMSAMEQMVSRIAESFATTFVSELFRKMHSLFMKYGKGELQAQQQGGDFVSTDPRTWRERSHVSVTIGKTLGEKMRQSAALQQVLQGQLQLMEMGKDGTMVDDGAMYNALVDAGRAMGLPTPQQYWVDPNSQQAQQAAQQKAEQAQQAQQAQQQQMQELVNVQMQLQQMQEESKRMKAQLDYRKAQEDRMADMQQALEELVYKFTELEMKAKVEADKNYQQNMRTIQGGRNA